MAAGLLLATGALYLRDPHTSGSWGMCPTKFLTGVECPGCGGLRAVNDLAHLDFVAAVSSNLLVVMAIPVAVLLWLRWVRDAWAGSPAGTRPRALSTPVVTLILVSIVVFTVLRNLPVGAWLAP